MKRFVCLLFVLIFIPLFAFADPPDISALSYDELVSLRENLNIAIWNCHEWRHVEVPAGVYIVGVDIPAGHWTLNPPSDGSVVVEYFKDPDETGKRPANSLNNYYSESLADESSPYASFVYVREVDLELKDGFYFTVVNGPYVVFEPYTSKPSFSFFD